MFSVGAYLMMDHCALLECTVTHENNYSLTNLTRRIVSRSKESSATLNVQRSAINRAGCERHYLHAALLLLKEKACSQELKQRFINEALRETGDRTVLSIVVRC